MIFSNRCLCLAISVVIFLVITAEISMMCIFPSEMEMGGYEYPRLAALGLGLLAGILIFFGALLRIRVLLWIGIPIVIVIFVILLIVDIIVLIKYLNEISNTDEAYGILNILFFLIIFPLYTVVSWLYAKELRTNESTNRCLNCLGC